MSKSLYIIKLNPNVRTDIKQAPKREANKPREEIPPDIPLGTGLNVIILTGFLLLKTPISDAHVSAVDTAYETQNAKKNSGDLYKYSKITNIEPMIPFAST
jgi:hypothetical protein